MRISKFGQKSNTLAEWFARNKGMSFKIDSGKTFYSTLEKIARDSGVSISFVADYLSIDHRKVWKYKSGSFPRKKLLDRISEESGINFDYTKRKS